MLTQLIRLGLSEKEAKVYLAALELGSQTAQAIARKAGVNRATTYVILQSLVKKGLVSPLTAGQTTSFTAEAPEHLDHLLRKAEEEIFEQRRDLEKMIPELRALYQRAPGKPLVRFYDGEEGIRLMVTDLWRQIDVATTLKIFLALDEGEWEATRLLVPPTAETQMRIITSRRPTAAVPIARTVEVRVLDPRDFPLEATLVITPARHHVGVISRRHRTSGMVLENPELARSLESLFDVTWRGLRR